MKLSQLVFIVLVGILFSMCGKPKSEKETSQVSPTFASYVAQGSADDVTRPVNLDTNDPNKIILHKKKDELSGITIYQVPLPANWKLTSSGMVGPDGTVVEKTDLRVLDLRFSSIKCIDDLVQDEVIPALFREGKKVTKVVDLPGIARNNQRSYAMFCDPTTAITSHAVKGIEFIDAQGKKGLAVVQCLVTKTDQSETLGFKTSILTANPEQFNQAKTDLIFGMRNKRLNPEFVAFKNYQASQMSRSNNVPTPSSNTNVWNGSQVDKTSKNAIDFQRLNTCDVKEDQDIRQMTRTSNNDRYNGYPNSSNGSRNRSIYNSNEKANDINRDLITSRRINEDSRFDYSQEFNEDIILEGDLEMRTQIRQELFGGRFENGQAGMTYEESQYIDQMVEQELQRRKAMMNQDADQASADQLVSNNWMYQ